MNKDLKWYILIEKEDNDWLIHQCIATDNRIKVIEDYINYKKSTTTKTPIYRVVQITFGEHFHLIDGNLIKVDNKSELLYE